MKKYFYIATIAAFMLSGCEDFLDTENYTKKNTGNFPETVEDIDMMLNGVYVSLNHIISNSGRNQVRFLFRKQLQMIALEEEGRLIERIKWLIN